MKAIRSFEIAVLPGDGIGAEVMAAALKVLDAVIDHVGGFRCVWRHFRAGAQAYRDTGTALADEVMKALEELGKAARQQGPLENKTAHLIQLGAAAAIQS